MPGTLVGARESAENGVGKHVYICGARLWWEETRRSPVCHGAGRTEGEGEQRWGGVLFHTGGSEKVSLMSWHWSGNLKEQMDMFEGFRAEGTVNAQARDGSVLGVSEEQWGAMGLEPPEPGEGDRC